MGLHDMITIAPPPAKSNRPAPIPDHLADWGSSVLSFVRLAGCTGGRCQRCGIVAAPLYVAVGRTGRIAGPVCGPCCDDHAQRVAPVGDALPDILLGEL